MADKYWVGGGSTNNWNATTPTNWANTDGGTGNQTAPTTGDRVFFTSNSGTGASLWNVNVSLTGLDCTGSKNQVTQGATVVITLTAGNLVLPDGVGSSYTPGATSSGFTFTGTATQQIKGNGAHVGNLILNGSGGTFQLTGDLFVDGASSSNVTLTLGTFDTQGFTLTTPIFNSSGSSTRAIQGSGAWNHVGTAAATIWNVASTLTASSFTATVTFSGAFSGTKTLSFGGKTYTCPIVIDANSGDGIYLFNNNNGFSSLTIAGRNVVVQTNGSTQTLTGALTLNGSSGAPILLQDQTVGGATGASFVAGASSPMTWALFRDIKMSGAGAPFVATNSWDMGGNTGFTTIASPSTGVSRSRLHLGH